MQITNRIDIKNLILHIEKNYAVNDWKVNDIHIWPLLRVRLYMSIIYSIENPRVINSSNSTLKKSSSKIFNNRILNKIKRETKKIKLNRWINSLPEKDNVFLGFDVHRVDYKNTRFNRFFDTFIIKNSFFEKYLYLEQGIKSTKPYFESKNIYFFSEYNKIFDSLIDRNQILIDAEITLESYDEFITYLRSLDCTHQFLKEFNFNVNNHNLKKMIIQLEFSKIILKKIKPKNVFALCYYNDEFMMLTAIANQMKINTIEYQHGPQTDIHMAYSNWSAIPPKGYDMLPHIFWNWDLHSAQIINNWAKSHTLYSSEVVGNFWVEYWKNQHQKMDESDFILYTLQPNPLTKEQLFPNNLISFILNNNFKWYFRLHPSQFPEKNKIEALIKSYNIEDKVNIERATNEPLPLLLAHCRLHMTNFSGSTIEASQMDKFTVLLNPIGASGFKELIEENKAIFIDPTNDDFQLQLINYV